MSIFEYDEEKELKLIREAEYQQGIEQGIEQGIRQGEILKSVEIVKNAMERFQLSLEEACDFAKISVAEYQKYTK